MRINDCIKNYQSGIIYDGDNSCRCSEIQTVNHAATIVGFGIDEFSEPCKEYWVIKNSWGAQWGEEGFFRLCKEELP